MTLPTLGSDTTIAYDRLHPHIRRWIREQRWSELRDIQAQATAAILGGGNDVLIAAATAAGKTEAAFLPILTKIADRANPGLSVLYVSPLKALINDQFRRLDLLCERLEIPVVRWHGDAPQSAKSKMMRNPSGIALITPESIEAMFVRRPADAKRLLSKLDFIVVDELHAFMLGPRGLHLASLLKRIDSWSQKPARRIGLSATIGDLVQAAAWLRPSDPLQVVIMQDVGEGLDLKLQIRGYLEHVRTTKRKGEESAADADNTSALGVIADHLFRTLRGSNNLVFGGSRKIVETTSDALRRRSEAAEVPNEFFPHHGNLSKDLREELETRLKNSSLPTTAVCTTTLELGIDIGSVISVAQIGAPRSIASLRQRLGRTGRRQGVPSVLRVYIREQDLGSRSGILDELRPDIIRAVAAIRLLAARFVEPTSTSDALATALLHQTLSIISERGGARADALFRLLGGPGPFQSVTPIDYADLLRCATAPQTKLIEQAPDGTLMLGERGEQIVQSRDFYALFQGEAEWRLVVGPKVLGTIPISNVVAKGNLVLFAGRRWLIEEIDEHAHVLQVAPHQGGSVPQFEPVGGEEIHDALIEEMRHVYESDDTPGYLDDVARSLLTEGRAAYHRLDLHRLSILEAGSQIHLFPWLGSAASSVFAVALATVGLGAEAHDLGITIPGVSANDVDSALRRIAGFSPDDLSKIESFAAGLRTAKFDEYISEDLLRRFWKRRNSQIISIVPQIARRLVRP
jgi:ATP-dependent Lhr-like helicase